MKSKMNLKDIKQFVKLEFSGWNKFEIAGFISVLVIILFNTVSLHDNPISIIYAILTYNGIRICKCHIFLVTLLMQSNKSKVVVSNFFMMCVYKRMIIIHECSGKHLFSAGLLPSGLT